MANLKVGLLGGGSWGTTVASLLTRNVPVTLWARNPATVAEINNHHTNSTYLPGAVLPDKLVATNDIAEAVCGADVVVMGIPSQNFRSVLLEVKQHIRAWVPVIRVVGATEQIGAFDHALWKRSPSAASGSSRGVIAFGSP